MKHLDLRSRAFCLFIIFVLLFILTGSLLQGQEVLAQKKDPLKALEEVAGEAGLGTETNISVIIGKIIKIVFSLIGIILLVLLIAGGFMWMTAGGNAEQVTKARTMMTNAFIGLVIIVLAYAISTFVISKLSDVTKPAPPTPPDTLDV